MPFRKIGALVTTVIRKHKSDIPVEGRLTHETSESGVFAPFISTS